MRTLQYDKAAILSLKKASEFWEVYSTVCIQWQAYHSQSESMTYHKKIVDENGRKGKNIIYHIVQ